MYIPLHTYIYHEFFIIAQFSVLIQVANIKVSTLRHRERLHMFFVFDVLRVTVSLQNPPGRIPKPKIGNYLTGPSQHTVIDSDLDSTSGASKDRHKQTGSMLVNV